MWLPYEPVWLSHWKRLSLTQPNHCLSHHCSESFTWSSLPGAICLLSSWLECKLQESRTVSVLVIIVVPASGIQLSLVVMCLTGRWNKFKIVGSNAFILQTSVRLRRVKMTDVSLLVPGTPAMSFPPSNVFLNSQESLEKIHGNDLPFYLERRTISCFWIATAPKISGVCSNKPEDSLLTWAENGKHTDVHANTLTRYSNRLTWE